MPTEKDFYAGMIAGLMDYYGDIHLARILNVRVGDLHQWSTGKGRPPSDVFFRMINLATQALRVQVSGMSLAAMLRMAAGKLTKRKRPSITVAVLPAGVKVSTKRPRKSGASKLFPRSTRRPPLRADGAAARPRRSRSWPGA